MTMDPRDIPKLILPFYNFVNASKNALNYEFHSTPFFYNGTVGSVATIAVLFRSPWTHKAQRGVLLVIPVRPYSSVTTHAVVQ
jgi:hypothetical protein